MTRQIVALDFGRCCDNGKVKHLLIEDVLGE
jgi:hypothetical protein